MRRCHSTSRFHYLYIRAVYRKIAFARAVQLSEDGNQFNGQIIDTVEAHVLEGFEDGTFSRAGESGEDDELPRFASL